MLHPQLVVERGGDGRLLRVLDIDDNADVPEGAIVESWMHIELDLLPPEAREQLAANLRRVLADVLYAVADAPRDVRAPAGAGRHARAPTRASSTGRPAGRPASCCAGWPTATS